jgi:hypothetical protein
MLSHNAIPALFVSIRAVAQMRLPGLLALLAGLCIPSLAQEVEATLLGNVRTRRGTPLVNAQVALTNLETGISRETQTDPTGAFSIRFLQAGTYSIEVQAPDRQRGVLERFLLRPGQVLRLDFELRPLTEVREQASPSLTWMETESAAIRRLVEPRNIRDLPLNGRNFVQLAQLLAGVFSGTPGSLASNQGRAWLGESSPQTGATVLAANGFRDTANRYFLDGIEFLDFETNSYPFSPSVDALAEVKVETNNYSALYGAAPGAQVDLVTEGGGTRYRGTLWAFNRNDAFSQSRDVIAGATVTPPRLNRNQYGVNLGGPVQVPRLLAPEATSFFFVNWEGGRLREGMPGEPRRVPTLAMRQGDFGAVTNARDGSPILLRDPIGAGFANNRVPEARQSPAALAFLHFVAPPNRGDAVLNYRSADQTATAQQENAVVRLDQSFRNLNLLTLRYAFNETYERGAEFWGNDERRNLARGQNLLGQYTRSFGARRVNQLRFGWNRLADSESFGTANRPDFDVASAMRIPQLSRRPEDFGPPSMRIEGPDGIYDVFALPRASGPRARNNASYQFSNVLSWQNGPHTVRLGGEWIRKYENSRLARDPRGSFEFDGAYSGAAIADLLLGYVRSATVAPTLTTEQLHTDWHSLYIQDDWRVRSDLTLNLGWRWDLQPAFYQRDGRMVNIGQEGFELTGIVTPENSPFGKRMRQTTYTNFGPRVGIAWSPAFLAKVVIRSGYGMYFSPSQTGPSFRMAEAAQETQAAAVRGSLTGIPDVFLDNPFPNQPANPVSNLAVSVDPYLKDAYVHHWNFTLQRKVLLGFLLDAGYVGSRGTRLPVTFDDMNRPIAVVNPSQPGLAPLDQRRPNGLYPRAVVAEKSVGISNFHSFQASASRSSTAGLELVLAYTWSKCMSGPGDAGGMIPGGDWAGKPQDLYNLRADRSLCGFDRTHRFTGSVLYETRVRSGPAPFRWLLDGWRIAAIPALSSGAPAPIFYNLDTTGTGLASRPDRLDGQRGDLPRSERSYARWFNTAAFAPTPLGRFGTAPRTGAVRLPGTRNLDLAFARVLNLQDQRRAELRAEVFNAANHFNPPPASLDLNLQSLTFGTIGGGVQGITTRVIQLALKLHF